MFRMSRRLTSFPTEKKYLLRFVNKTGRNVDILWINYEGEPVRYHTILPEDHLDMNTYISHTWTFEDTETRDKRAVNNLPYYPADWEKYFFYDPETIANLNIHEQISLDRIILMIKIPMYSLSDCCLQVFRDSFNWKQNIALLDQLKYELPKTLYDELFMMVIRKELPFSKRLYKYI
uniref:von Hippel-Lindau disease tumour suppressor beta domain-containing protein n=1 Tax=Cuerna arida TaxID=1464854 RepID=A0A1B6F2K0_9HEMI